MMIRLAIKFISQAHKIDYHDTQASQAKTKSTLVLMTVNPNVRKQQLRINKLSKRRSKKVSPFNSILN